jgi:solute carrier family 25 oxoglutarate transporter 11
MDSYIIGCLSGLTATSLVQPIDYIKVNSQLNPNVNKLSLLKNIYNNHGFLEFYRGINIALIRQCVYGTLRLGLFQDLKDNYKVNPISAAVIAASVGTIINNPIDYLLIKKQTENNFSIKNIIKNEKINTILFSGLKYNLLRAISINIGFGCKTIYENKLKNHFNNNLFIKSGSIITAGITSAVISMPFDVMRTYSQKNMPIINNLIIFNNVNKKINSVFSIKNINLIASFKSIYNTFPIYFMRITPHSIISLACLDFYTSIFNKLKK